MDRPKLEVADIFRRYGEAYRLGTELAFSSPPPLCCCGRRNLTRWHSVDLLPTSFLLARASALPPVPPIVLDVSGGGLRLRQVTVLLFSRDTTRSAGFPPSSGPGAQLEMGRLR